MTLEYGQLSHDPSEKMWGLTKILENADHARRGWTNLMEVAARPSQRKLDNGAEGLKRSCEDSYRSRRRRRRRHVDSDLKESEVQKDSGRHRPSNSDEGNVDVGGSTTTEEA